MTDHLTPRRRVVTRRTLGLGLVTALALSACQFGTGDPDASSTAPSTDPGGGTGAASDGGGATATGSAVADDDATGAGVDLTDLGEAVATATIPAIVEGDAGATMTVSLYGLRRTDNTLAATFSFLVTSATSDKEEWIYTYLGNQAWSPYAIDTVNLNKHGVMNKDLKKAQTDYQGVKFRPGQTLYAFAVFAAPPADVASMDVSLVDGAPLATGVKIQ